MTVDISQVIRFLGCKTPQAWLDEAPKHMALLLQDHANCEKKAAGTALNLMYKYNDFTDLQIRLAQLVREEMLHYEQVLELLQKRGQPWQSVSASRYAGGLRQSIRTFEPAAMIDILVVGAFVEARSCERFAALMPYVDTDLAKFYGYLLKSEARHFMDYLALAETIAGQSIQERINIVRKIEQDLILSPDTQMRFHSGIPVHPLMGPD